MIELARVHLTCAEPRRDAARLEVVRARLTDARRWHRRATFRVSFAAVGAAAVALLLLLWAPDAPLGMEVLAGTLSASGEVAPSRAPTTLRFSDGTQVVVEADASAQVMAVSARGADVRLEQGHARFRVAKRPGANWNVLAGAYRVHVTGTAFEVAFDRAHSNLEVELFAGSVRVSGPLLERGIDVAKGQRLSVNPSLGFQVTSLEEEPGKLVESPAPDPSVQGESLPSVDAGVVKALSDGRSRTRKAGSAERPTEATWQSRVAAGQFAEVLAAAEQRGLGSVYQTAGLAELAALADAARYARRTAIAREALLAIRRRFSGSSQAKEAAFLLGRLSEARTGEAGAALGWYERYLEEDPSGVYASQALGRKLLIVHRESGAARAAPIAQEYLRRFPGGPHAPNARKLIVGR